MIKWAIGLLILACIILVLVPGANIGSYVGGVLIGIGNVLLYIGWERLSKNE